MKKELIYTSPENLISTLQHLEEEGHEVTNIEYKRENWFYDYVTKIIVYYNIKE